MWGLLKNKVLIVHPLHKVVMSTWSVYTDLDGPWCVHFCTKYILCRFDREQCPGALIVCAAYMNWYVWKYSIRELGFSAVTTFIIIDMFESIQLGS